MLFSPVPTILLVVSCLAQQPSVVSDPVADFIALDLRYSNRVGSIEEIYVVKADIGGSTEPEIFITHQNMYVDRSGYWWEVYRPVRGGYQRVQQAVTNSSGEVVGSKSGVRFRTDAFHVGTVDGVEGTSLFSYWPSGSGVGGLMGIWLEDGLVVRRKVRDMLVGHRGPDSDLYEKLFVAGMGEIVKAKVEDLTTKAQRLALIGGTADPSEPGGFVSRAPGESDAEPENSAASPREAGSVADVPAIRTESSEKVDEPTAAAEAAPSEEPAGSGWSGGTLVLSIGAIAFLLTLAGYRVFSKKGHSGS